MFQQATGCAPYGYQRRLALEPDWPAIVRVPTGAGKTAAVVLAWLWRACFAPEDVRRQTPRRLIYCLPQRTLVEQTRAAAEQWLHALGLAATIPVHVLMGGDLARDWDVLPERRQILVGTQDQLLSRALNRGYGMSRYRWPMHFALLHDDCLWAIDEPQLFGDALATTAQLQAFRQQLGTWRPVRTIWLSATVQPEWLATVDYAPYLEDARVLELDEADRVQLQTRLDAPKPLLASGLRLTEKAADKPAAYAEELAQYVRRVHRPGTLTLVIVNRVARAQLVYQALDKAQAADRVLLIHSRFRLAERVRLNQALPGLAGTDTILVATQAVEAGVDLSAETLVTELAPWTSLVQRFGRCNRDGKAKEPSVHWVDIETGAKAAKAAAPYLPEELDAARARLQGLADVRIRALPAADHPVQYRHVLRRRDLLALFDTTPDLTGYDIDVSPYVRDADDADVTVFWREWPWEGEGGRMHPPHDLLRPSPAEVCRVSLSALREYLQLRSRGRDEDAPWPAWTWDALRGNWRRVREHELIPGQLLLLDAREGGYTPDLGFHPVSRVPVPVIADPGTPGRTFETHDRDDDNAPLQAQSGAEQGNGMAPAGDAQGEPVSQAAKAPGLAQPVPLGLHLREVADEAARLAAAFPEVPDLAALLSEAAWHHDRGKAHRLYQARIAAVWPQDLPRDAETLWAKSPQPGGAWPEVTAEIAGRTRSAKHFRHELASALAYLADVAPEKRNDLAVRLVAYLIAAHHGKVRVHIQSVPDEQVPEDDRLFARGVWDGDALPAVPLPDGRRLPPATLRLGVMRAGTDPKDAAETESWVMGVQRLLAHPDYGPFRLAWLEAMLRVADWRASQKEVYGDAS
ncbi:hypothetical protein GCM10010885_11450 [Alicyclobacillus cellulosilyticus]|uniref:CRISPR-associated endonuclease/helicase Cas3 n=1 Tax=Alicyclobacillus cellulosilyticus TaxID=1003997 RepID=A0A917NIX5_9BACL|nr:CRISPR-associated endonuclease Cas3'' [Alicyclobacillus cellulosilyticus]GGJ03933.1 hypothetical protein GCM10010885_11450 [Alicyclobacillus cellulosilyticus]